jgi:hypothetical protein
MHKVSVGAVRESRPPFCYQTIDALRAIRERFDGPRVASALGVYTTLTEVANEVGGDAARESFEATRKRIAGMCGISIDTLDRYVKVFEEIGVIEVERRVEGSAHLPNVWRICAPPGRTDSARVTAPKRHIRAGSPPVEEKSEEPSGGELALAAPKQGARALAQTLVAYFVDESRKLGSEPPRRVTGQVAARVGEMLGEGITPDRVRRGIDAMLLKRIDPRNLPSLVQEVSLPRRPQPRRDDGFNASEYLAGAVADARKTP